MMHLFYEELIIDYWRRLLIIDNYWWLSVAIFLLVTKHSQAHWFLTSFTITNSTPADYHMSITMWCHFHTQISSVEKSLGYRNQTQIRKFQIGYFINLTIGAKLTLNNTSRYSTDLTDKYGRVLVKRYYNKISTMCTYLVIYFTH